MKAEIICWKTKDKIKISNISGLFEQISNTDDKNYFFHLNEDMFKIIYTEKIQEDLYSYYLEGSNNNLIFIVDEINTGNLKLINKVILNNNHIVIAGRIDLEDYDKYNLIKKVALLPQLYYGDEKINIKLILLLLENLIKEEKSECFLSGATIILGKREKDEPLGNIPLNILKMFNYIKDINETKHLELTIYSDIQQSMQELAYIKDPIMEYLSYGSVLKINQMVYDDINGKIYFSLVVK